MTRRERELREALEAVAHAYCGTSRVAHVVLRARQVLGWDYHKGCAESVEAVRRNHQERSI